MPVYDCMLLLKPHVEKAALMDLVARVGRHVIQRNGVLMEIKSFGKIYLGYGIKKRDGRYYQGQLLQMSMMATPNLNKELHYLNKENRLLRWLLVNHRDTKYGLDFFDTDDQKKFDLLKKRTNLYAVEEEEEEEDDENGESIANVEYPSQ